MGVRQGFRCTDPSLGMARIILEIAYIIETERVFMPIGIELRQPFSQFLGHWQGPQRMKLHHDIHLVAHRFADFAEWFQRRVQLLG